jgi:hypothetical protein
MSTASYVAGSYIIVLLLGDPAWISERMPVTRAMKIES